MLGQQECLALAGQVIRTDADCAPLMCQCTCGWRNAGRQTVMASCIWQTSLCMSIKKVRAEICRTPWRWAGELLKCCQLQIAPRDLGPSA